MHVPVLLYSGDGEQLVAMPALCTDADGVDCEDIHRNLIAEAARFFTHTLGRPSRPVTQAPARRWSNSVSPRPVTESRAAQKKIHEYPRFKATAPIKGPAMARARSKNTA